MPVRSRRSQPPGRHHDRETQHVRPPVHRARSGGPGHARGGLAGNRHRTRHLRLVLSGGGGRAPGRTCRLAHGAGRGRPGHRHRLGTATPAGHRRTTRLATGRPGARHRVDDRTPRRGHVRRAPRPQPLRRHRRLGRRTRGHRGQLARLLRHPAALSRGTSAGSAPRASG